jgi:hypothetical protein
VEGDFSLLGPIDLLQLLSQSGRSGVFRVPGGEVYLESGNPTHAQFKNTPGPDGLFQILALKQSQFRFVVGGRAPQTTLSGSLSNYLLQALGHVEDAMPISPFDEVKMINQTQASQLTLPPQNQILLQALSEPQMALDMANSVGLSLEQLQPLLRSLARLGVVQINSRTPRTARLQVSLLEHHSGYARLDSNLMFAWRNHYGSFKKVEVRIGNRQLQLTVEAIAGAGNRMMMPREVLMFHDFQVGQEVLVWPAL